MHVPAVQVSTDVEYIDLNASFTLMLKYPHHWKCPPLLLESLFYHHNKSDQLFLALPSADTWNTWYHLGKQWSQFSSGYLFMLFGLHLSSLQFMFEHLFMIYYSFIFTFILLCSHILLPESSETLPGRLDSGLEFLLRHKSKRVTVQKEEPVCLSQLC